MILAGISSSALADTPITAGSGWQVDGIYTAGKTVLSGWTFSLAAGDVGTFRVVDSFLVGDTWRLYKGTTLLATSTTGTRTTTGFTGDYEDSWLDASYSALAYTFSGAGNYSFDVFGDGGGGLPAAVGVSLSVAAVPEPETYALMLAGLGVLGFVARRRKAAQA